MIILCPTRGRPDKAAEMLESFRATAVRFDTTVALVVDADDPTLPAYRELPDRFATGVTPYPLQAADKPVLMVLPERETGDLVRATNTAAARVWDTEDIIGHVGDDHRFRTPGWDRRIREALRDPGVAYGDDGYMGERLPTAVFMSAAIPRALGWYALPTAQHLYIDRAWKLLGETLGSLHYLPEVAIEHMHPEAGKAEWDETYSRGNADAVWRHDRAAFRRWRRSGLAEDVARVRTALGQAVAA